MSFLTSHSEGTVIAIKAQPGSKRSLVLGQRGDVLRIAVTAAPERGKANEAIVSVLAQALRVKGSQIRLLSGETSRDKRFLIDGITIHDLQSRLLALLETPR